MELTRLIDVLSDPGLYPGHPPVELRQTHASCVFLTPTDVYKLKKPVDLGFLDYSTLARRRLMCNREVRLNQRLAPHVYLGVKRLVAEDGRFALRDRGSAIDYLVHMRRLPDEDTLAARLAAGRVGQDDVAKVAALLAGFHQRAAVAPPSYGTSSLIRRNALDNLDRVTTGATGLLEPAAAEVRDYTLAFLRENAGLFADRVAGGRIRDGHGDLRCEHVYLHRDGSISVIDCIEFNSSFRYTDVALDLAFLAMDLATSGYPDLADALVSAYEAASGDAFGELLGFYCCYRAMVRSKVAYLRSQEREFSAAEREAALVEAAAYLGFAARFARGDSRPVLVLVGGLTGTGKTTAAGLVAETLRAPIVTADEVRKRLGGLGPGVHPPAQLDAGLYARAMNERVYAALLDAADRRLRRGRSVILDATYRRREDRAAARALAAQHGARFLAVECVAPREVVRARLAGRQAAGGDRWSDGTWEVYEAQARAQAPFSELPASERFELDTTLSRFEQARRFLESFLAPGPGEGPVRSVRRRSA